MTRLQVQRVEKGIIVICSALEADACDGFAVVDDVHIDSANVGGRLIGYLDLLRPGPSELTTDHRQAHHCDDGCESFSSWGEGRRGVHHPNRGYGD